jgi:hypothetical protein
VSGFLPSKGGRRRSRGIPRKLHTDQLIVPVGHGPKVVDELIEIRELAERQALDHLGWPDRNP